MNIRQLEYDSLKLKMEGVGFQFEREQKPFRQHRKEMELKFVHPQLIKKWKEEGYIVRAKKFYIKPLSDEPDCEIGFVTGKSSPLNEARIFSPPNSYDSHDNGRAWVNGKTDPALDNLLESIINYLS